MNPSPTTIIPTIIYLLGRCKSTSTRVSGAAQPYISGSPLIYSNKNDKNMFLYLFLLN